MEQQALLELAQEYRTALVDELNAKGKVLVLQANVAYEEARILAAAYADGTIDGKNADTRKRQEADVLASNASYQRELELLKEAEAGAGFATVDRQYQDALLGLTKAWLYSQSGHS